MSSVLHRIVRPLIYGKSGSQFHAAGRSPPRIRLAERMMGVDECSMPLRVLANMPFPERVLFLETNLTSLRPALDQFADKAWEISGSRGLGTSRQSFVAEHRDMFCRNSLARLLAARIHPKANTEGMPEDETPVDTIQVDRARAIIEDHRLDLNSPFHFYDRWLAATRSEGGLSRLAELAFLRACEEGCHPQRTHSRTLAFQWFYEHFASNVEQSLTVEYQGCLDKLQIDGAVVQGMNEFYQIYLPANNSPLLRIQRGYIVRSRWAGRAFLANFLRNACRLRLPPLFYVLRDSGHGRLRTRQLSPAAIDALRKIIDFTFDSDENILAIARSADPTLSMDQEQQLRDELDRTVISNPLRRQKQAVKTAINGLEELENCVVGNQVPNRGVFGASVSNYPEGDLVLAIGQKLKACIALVCNQPAPPQCAISSGACRFALSCGDRQLTNREQVRLKDYWYHESSIETRTQQAAATQSRRDGFVRLRNCFAALLGRSLKLKAAARLRECQNSGKLPPGGLIALLFNEEYCRRLCNTGNKSLDEVAARYHICALPYRKLLTKDDEQYYRPMLKERQRSDPEAKIVVVVEEDLLRHWQQISTSIGAALDSLGPVLSERED